MPVPGAKAAVEPLNAEVRCGGVSVNAGDVVVADEEGIVVIPSARREHVLSEAQTKFAKEANESLDAWQEAHRARIEEILRKNGFED